MKYAIIFLISCCFLFSQCKQETSGVDQNQLNFIGPGSGCVDFFVFKLNENKKIALTVSGIKEALQLNQDLKSFDLATESHLTVKIDQWSNDKNYYCNDVILPDMQILNSYDATSGIVKVQIVEDSINYSGAASISPELLYKVDVHLENINFKDSDGNELVIPQETFTDVLVGWYPG